MVIELRGRGREGSSPIPPIKELNEGSKTKHETGGGAGDRGSVTDNGLRERKAFQRKGVS